MSTVLNLSAWHLCLLLSLWLCLFQIWKWLVILHFFTFRTFHMCHQPFVFTGTRTKSLAHPVKGWSRRRRRLWDAAVTTIFRRRNCSCVFLARGHSARWASCFAPSGAVSVAAAADPRCCSSCCCPSCRWSWSTRRSCSTGRLLLGTFFSAGGAERARWQGFKKYDDGPRRDERDTSGKNVAGQTPNEHCFLRSTETHFRCFREAHNTVKILQQLSSWKEPFSLYVCSYLVQWVLRKRIGALVAWAFLSNWLTNSASSSLVG